MAEFSKIKLSGGVNGKNIKVAATATPGTLIHTADANELDEIWLFGSQFSGADVDLTIEFGGVASPDDLVRMAIPSGGGWFLVIPGHLLAAGLVVRAFGGSANAVVVNGFVNRITG